MAFYVDVHTHLTHSEFSKDKVDVVQRASHAGLGAIVVNGLGPKSNREILELARDFPIVKAALGIYPIEAVNELLPSTFKFHLDRFDVKEEIAFIARMAAEKKIRAVGECGLDGFHLGEETFAKQERVFGALIDIAITAQLPVIVHSRKREERVLEILAEKGAKKVNMHCYGGKLKSALQAAEQHGWCFSIPANIERSQSFQALAKKLPRECILTETDAPYLGPVVGVRNEPKNVVHTVQHIAQLRGESLEACRQQIWDNYTRLFS